MGLPIIADRELSLLLTDGSKVPFPERPGDRIL
jgi:hypothetical protein